MNFFRKLKKSPMYAKFVILTSMVALTMMTVLFLMVAQGNDVWAYVGGGVLVLDMIIYLGGTTLFWRCDYCGEALPANLLPMLGMDYCPYCGNKLG